MTSVPPKEADGKRRYDQWAGNPAGRIENMEHCAMEIPSPPSWHYAQCGRKRGHGPNGEFCKQHAKKAQP